jgi:hypothetical protein
MAWVRVVDGRVVLKSCNQLDGGVEADDSVAVGMLYANGEFLQPELVIGVPEYASKLRLYEILYASGDWPQIAGALATDEHASNVWQFATIIERNHPMIEQFRILLGWSSQQVDDLFRAAQ